MVPCEPVPTSLPEQSKDKRYNDPLGADGETQSINLLVFQSILPVGQCLCVISAVSK